ncbi:hypothetical protein [Pseudoalteromonas luteoviolacea]|nr:hypothetical protein [Pseudoalteromonas luteoviolacea]
MKLKLNKKVIKIVNKKELNKDMTREIAGGTRDARLATEITDCVFN